MHSRHPVQRPHVHARREAEKLFRRLQNPELPRTDETIRVFYSERFVCGKAIIALVIPANKLPLGKGQGEFEALRETKFPPYLHAAGPSFVLILPYPHIAQGELKLLIGEAHQRARWAEMVWGVKAVVSPGGPRISMLIGLHALTLCRSDS